MQSKVFLGEVKINILFDHLRRLRTFHRSTEKSREIVFPHNGEYLSRQNIKARKALPWPERICDLASYHLFDLFSGTLLLGSCWPPAHSRKGQGLCICSSLCLEWVLFREPQGSSSSSSHWLNVSHLRCPLSPLCFKIGSFTPPQYILLFHCLSSHLRMSALWQTDFRNINALRKDWKDICQTIVFFGWWDFWGLLFCFVLFLDLFCTISLSIVNIIKIINVLDTKSKQNFPLCNLLSLCFHSKYFICREKWGNYEKVSWDLTFLNALINLIPTNTTTSLLMKNSIKNAIRTHTLCNVLLSLLNSFFSF